MLLKRPAPRVVAPYVAIILLSALMVALYVRAYPKVSPIDEMQHFDYAEKISRGELVRAGDRVGEAAMREESCRGIDADFAPPPCDAEVLHPEQYQELGYSTAYGQAPTYYLITGLGGRLITKVLGLESLLTGMRLFGAFWLALGLSLTWAALGAAGVHAAARMAVIGLLLSTPVVLGATAVMNPDAVLVPAGAAMLLATFRLTGRVRSVVLGVIVFVSVLSEPTTLLAAGAVVGYLAIAALHARLSTRELDRASQLLALGAVVLFAVAGSWIANDARAEIVGGTDPGLNVPKNRQFHTTTVTAADVVGQLPALVTPVRNVYLPPMFRTATIQAILTATDWFLLAGVIGTAALAARGTFVAAASASTLIVMVTGGPGLALLNALGSQFYAIPGRYGLPLLPGLALGAASLLQKPFAKAAACVLALVAVNATLWTMVTAH